jgi:4'-phosphopantetheinyl transferase EntD
VAAALLPIALGLDLGPEIVSCGFGVEDPERALEALSDVTAPEAPAAAVSKRRAEFLAGRLAAQHALTALGFPPEVGRSSDGSPRWPEGAVGSITHGAGRALCAVGRARQLRGLGIDVERYLGPDSAQALWWRICTERELACAEKALQRVPHELVALIFSAKESLYKSLHFRAQRYLPFSAAELVAVCSPDCRTGRLELELRQDWAPEFREGRKLQAEFLLEALHVETAVALPW